MECCPFWEVITDYKKPWQHRRRCWLTSALCCSLLPHIWYSFCLFNNIIMQQTWIKPGLIPFQSKKVWEHVYLGDTEKAPVMTESITSNFGKLLLLNLYLYCKNFPVGIRGNFFSSVKFFLNICWINCIGLIFPVYIRYSFCRISQLILPLNYHDRCFYLLPSCFRT